MLRENWEQAARPNCSTANWRNFIWTSDGFISITSIEGIIVLHSSRFLKMRGSFLAVDALGTWISALSKVASFHSRCALHVHNVLSPNLEYKNGSHEEIPKPVLNRQHHNPFIISYSHKHNPIQGEPILQIAISYNENIISPQLLPGTVWIRHSNQT